MPGLGALDQYTVFGTPKEKCIVCNTRTNRFCTGIFEERLRQMVLGPSMSKRCFWRPDVIGCCAKSCKMGESIH